MMVELPNEIVLMVIDYLPQPCRKRMRLVCRTWAALGANGLIDRVYISPFEKDLDVFDAITRHPVFSRAIKHLVYDSAQFASDIETDADYFRALCDCTGNHRMAYMTYDTTFKPEFRDLRRAIVDSLVEPSIFLSGSQPGLQRCQTLAAFVDGYRQYLHHAKEMSIIAAASWVDRVDRGLKQMRSVESITIRNSWNMIFEHRHDYPQEIISSFDFPHATKGYAIVDRNGMRLVGSPLARSWSPAYLQPRSIESHNDHDPIHGSPSAVSDGVVELSQVLQRINSAGMMQHIKKFVVSEYSDALGGVSPYAFLNNTGIDMQFTSLSTSLRILDLKLASSIAEPARQPMLDLQIFKRFLEAAQCLESMTLFLPCREDDFEARDVHSLYHFALVFPKSSTWNLPRLRGLWLHGLRASYSELVTLLVLNCPNLDYLNLSYFQLKDGYWEDIIEGLRRLPDYLASDFDEKGLLCSTDDLFLQWADTEERYEDGDRGFSYSISKYISDGGRHPCLARDAPDSASTKYMDRLNETLDKLRLATS